MAAHKKLFINVDGACRGNPGFSGSGIVIQDETGSSIEQLHDFLGVGTNNQAEYRALIAALEAAIRYRPESVVIRMDSQLVINQMNGAYRVRHPDLFPLYHRAMELASSLPDVSFQHVPRERNHTADRLANMAIDSRMVKGRGAVGE